MGHWSRVKTAKCQMLVAGFFVLLLGLSVATMAVLTRSGDHFTVIGQASLEKNPYKAVHHWAFYLGISLAGLLSLGAALSTTATVREAQGLMAMSFLCYALAFCILVQVVFWRFHNPTQVEDTVLDIYDLVYDQAMRSPSSSRWRELAAIQDTDCLQSIGSFLKTYCSIGAILTCASLALTVYAMMLCAFLWFAIRCHYGLDRKGRYALTPRTYDCQPQEPSFFRWTQGGPDPRCSSEGIC